MEVSTLLLSKRHHNVPIRGVIHVGGAMCEEWRDYRELNAEHVVWVEGNPKSCAAGWAVLRANGMTDRHIVLESFVSHKNGVETFYVTAEHSHNDSLMQPCEWYPVVAVKETKQVNVKRLDTLLADNGIDITKFNTLVLDVQGAELKVLHGCGDILNHMDFIVSECWYDELEVLGTHIYRGATTVSELKTMLKTFGFEETERIPPENEDLQHNHSWVDILLERKENEVA